MPKIIIDTFNAIKIFFYSTNEGPRPHLHFLHKDGTETKIWIDILEFKSKSGDKVFDRAMMKLAKEYQEEALREWEDIYDIKK